jgi:ATPase subunit of ABC transporter with duplicated ATPase domains
LLKSITGTKPEFIMEGKVTVMPGVRLGYLEQTAVSLSQIDNHSAFVLQV